MNGVLLRECYVRYFSSRAGLLMAFAEPIVTICVLIVLFRYLGRQAPIGETNMQYFAIAVMIYFTFVMTEKYVRSGVSANSNLFYLSVIKPNDIFVARAIIELLEKIATFLLMIFLFYLAMGFGWPDEYFATFAPFFVAGLLGFGFGIINLVITHYAPIYQLFWGLITRALFLTSGKFFLIEQMPRMAQEALYYNPILHLVSWSRTGYYEEYNSTFIDLKYPIIMAVVATFVGLVLERTFRIEIITAKRYMPV